MMTHTLFLEMEKKNHPFNKEMLKHENISEISAKNLEKKKEHLQYIGFATVRIKYIFLNIHNVFYMFNFIF